jgi:protein TonB
MSERQQTGQADDAASAKLRQLKQQQTAMLAQIKKQLSVNNAKQPTTASEAAEKEQQRRQLLDLLAEIEQRINEQNARPRTRYVSPSTREVSYALYHDHMRRLIEEHGTRFFPQAQGHKLYGSLTLLLTVNAQGRVIDSKVLKSSGQGELDTQALALAVAAGPFGVFTPEMKREFDQLAMVSRYTFKRNLTVQADNPDQ